MMKPKSRFTLATLAALTVSSLALGACAQDANQPPPMPMDGAMGRYHDGRCGMAERAKPLTEVQAKAIVDGMIARRGDDLVVVKTATLDDGRIVVDAATPGGEQARQFTFDAKSGRMLPPPGAQAQAGAPAPRPMGAPCDGPMAGPRGAPMDGARGMPAWGPMGNHHRGPFGPDDQCGPMAGRTTPLTEAQAKAVVEGLIAWRGDDLVVARTTLLDGGKIAVDVATPDGKPARQIVFDAKSGRMLPPPAGAPKK